MLSYKEFKKKLLDRLRTNEKISDTFVEILYINEDQKITQEVESVLVGENGLLQNSQMKHFYNMYVGTQNLYSILNFAILHYQDATLCPSFDIQLLNRLDTVKDCLFVRLVNKRYHSEFLLGGPVKKILDLSMTCRVKISENDHGLHSILVNHQMLANWHIDEDQLFQLALKNTYSLFQSELIHLDSIPFFTENADEEKKDNASECLDIYSITNTRKMNGAVTILFDGVLKSIGEKHHCNLFIIPSSTHEMLAIPDNTKIQLKDLESMLKKNNLSIPFEQDYLSDNIYYYCFQNESLTIASQSQ